MNVQVCEEITSLVSKSKITFSYIISQYNKKYSPFHMNSASEKIKSTKQDYESLSREDFTGTL